MNTESDMSDGLTMNEKIGMALGRASMAWSETPRGVFDSDTCSRLARELLNEYESLESQLAAANERLAKKNSEIESLIDEAKLELRAKDKLIEQLNAEVTRVFDPTRKFWNDNHEAQLTKFTQANTVMREALGDIRDASHNPVFNLCMRALTHADEIMKEEK